MGEKHKAILVTSLACLALLWPLTHGNDSFPLSTYPMFSSDLKEVTSIQLVVGMDAQQNRVSLSPQIIAGTDEVIQAGSYVRHQIRSGLADKLCLEALNRVAGDPEIVAVAVLTDEINAIAWYDGDKQPQSTLVHSTCSATR